MITTVTLNASIDKAYYMDLAIENGQVMRVSSCRNSAGGKGLNVARIIKLCQEDVLATGLVGGYNGNYLESLLNQDGINYDFEHVQGETRSCINILDPQYGSTEYLEPGCLIDSIEEKRFIERFKGLVEKSKIVTISGSVPKGVSKTIYQQLVTYVKEQGKQVILDTSGELLKIGLKAKPTMVKPNQDELEMLFITALNTGMRQGELFALTWDDINFDNNYININKTYKYTTDVSREGRKHTRGIIQTPKTKNSIRRVSIPSALSEQLKQYKLKQAEHRLALANLYYDNNLVFCTVYGKYLDSSNVRKKFNKVIDTININETDKTKLIAPRKFHDLRHTYATRLFELGEKAKTVQELLGHSNVSITLDIYTHVLEDMKLNAVSKLNDLYLTMRT